MIDHTNCHWNERTPIYCYTPSLPEIYRCPEGRSSNQGGAGCVLFSKNLLVFIIVKYLIAKVKRESCHEFFIYCTNNQHPFQENTVLQADALSQNQKYMMDNLKIKYYVFAQLILKMKITFNLSSPKVANWCKMLSIFIISFPHLLCFCTYLPLSVSHHLHTVLHCMVSECCLFLKKSKKPFYTNTPPSSFYFFMYFHSILCFYTLFFNYFSNFFLLSSPPTDLMLMSLFSLLFLCYMFSLWYLGYLKKMYILHLSICCFVNSRAVYSVYCDVKHVKNVTFFSKCVGSILYLWKLFFKWSNALNELLKFVHCSWTTDFIVWSPQSSDFRFLADRNMKSIFLLQFKAVLYIFICWYFILTDNFPQRFVELWIQFGKKMLLPLAESLCVLCYLDVVGLYFQVNLWLFYLFTKCLLENYVIIVLTCVPFMSFSIQKGFLPLCIEFSLMSFFTFLMSSSILNFFGGRIILFIGFLNIFSVLPHCFNLIYL